MADIDISRSHTMDPTEIRSEISGIAERMSDKLGLKHSWSGDRVSFSGKGASGFIEVGGSSVRVSIKLGLLAKPLKGKIQERVERELNERIK